MRIVERTKTRRVPHPPEFLRRASTIAHRVLGGLAGVAGVLALGQGISGNSRALHVWWSGTITVLGLLFVLFLLFHHGLRLLPAWLADLSEDPQQRQHLTMGLLIVAGGFAEFVRAQGWTTSAIAGYVWPLALVIIGILFVRHPQHGTEAALTRSVRFHRNLGLTLILAGLLAGGSVLRPAGIAMTLWPVVLIVGALLLVSYREPEGAWEDTAPGHASHR